MMLPAVTLTTMPTMMLVMTLGPASRPRTRHWTCRTSRSPGHSDVRLRRELLARGQVFVTPHRLQGRVLVLWLTRLGARVTGLSLPPQTDPSLFALCAQGCCTDLYGGHCRYGAGRARNCRM